MSPATEAAAAFWVDSARNARLSYADLVSEVRRTQSIHKCLYAPNPAAVLIELTAALAAGRQCLLLNGSYTVSELAKMNVSPEDLKETTPVELSGIGSAAEIIRRIAEQKENWRLGFFTSGTTGVPKRIDHDFSKLMRNVKIAPKYQADVWGLGFNPAHFAGIQVFFQALFNQNKIVNLFDVAPSDVSRVVESEGVSRISATPTYLRAILPFLGTHTAVRSVTSGGERFDDRVVDRLTAAFPNARIHNIYASTEAGSLFVSHGAYFEIPAALQSHVRISGEGELYLHRDLLAVTDQVLSGDWYRTGDVVTDLGEGRFQFKHRTSDVINVGGYKVDPLEVEEILKKVPGVLDALVRSRANSVTGGILVADVIASTPSEELKSRLREVATSELQPWKVPRLISFVSELKTNRSGKRERI